MWVALKDQNVDGQIRHAGEPVPEAASWPNRDPWVECGFIVWVDDPPNVGDSRAEGSPQSEPEASISSPNLLPSVIRSALFGKKESAQ